MTVRVLFPYGPRVSGRQRSKTVVKLEEARQAPRSRARQPPPVEPDPLYGVVLLKTALELKRRKDGSVEEILRSVLSRMRIPEHEFRAFLEQREDLRRLLDVREG
ncbi:MAG TPA: hypothetical protein VFD73_09315 [Gemmatimonadales bacterium]|nr:hypothetical protein [Gemmatimonadales bacterium]